MHRKYIFLCLILLPLLTRCGGGGSNGSDEGSVTVPPLAVPQVSGVAGGQVYTVPITIDIIRETGVSYTCTIDDIPFDPGTEYAVNGAHILKVTATRDFTRWPRLGVWVWPNHQHVPTTYDQEITNIKTWLTNRILWIDTHIGSRPE